MDGTTRSLAALAVIAVVASAAAGVAYQMSLNKSEPVPRAAFDVAAVSRPAPAPVPQAARDPSKSGLGMITTIPGIQFEQKADAPAPKAKAMSVQDLVKAAEGRVAALAWEYTRRYPLIRQYGRDWMSYPDLRKLNDDYMKNHDPMAFLSGVAASPNFGKILKKYATQKEIRDFVNKSLIQVVELHASKRLFGSLDR